MLYLDANIFIDATINTEELGQKSRFLLGQIQRGEETAETSALTFDEVFWAIKKHNLELAFTACEAMLNFPHLDVIPVDKGLAVSALQIIRECNLAPRDAVHAAAAVSGKADFIVSTDAHFSRVKELKWKDLK